MAHHKRKHPRNGGCLLCKPHKHHCMSWAKRYPKLAAYCEQDERQAKNGMV